MDPVFASVIITSLISIIALVAITYRQKDIAALALKILSQSADKTPPQEQNDSLHNQNNESHETI
jgi:hypothetical protein